MPAQLFFARRRAGAKTVMQAWNILRIFMMPVTKWFSFAYKLNRIDSYGVLVAIFMSLVFKSKIKFLKI